MDFLSNTHNIRNICILAHVDHGKTTIADSLIASNGIISHRMSGKMRYLDNRQEEQERGITMKSSSIALKYTNETSEKFLINLVDTPGHVDFCGEVSAAVRLCDGALIVVDVVEGVCPQTKVALEQAWKEGIEPILVLNKMDRLILEQKLDGTAAHLRLNQLLEQVNAIVATLLTTELFEDEATSSSNRQDSRLTQSDSSDCNDALSSESNVRVYDWASAIEDIDDDKHYFMPEKNNVIFASSIDDWAFTVGAFAKILSLRHKINLTALQRTLWGDFYIDIKQKRILKNAQAKAKKTLFVTMVLENIWKIYETVCVHRDKDKMEKMCHVLGVTLGPRDINHSEPRYQVKLIMSKWLQFAKNVLESIVNIVPSPKGLSEKRIERLLSSNMKRFHQLPEETQRLKKAFLDCSTSDESLKVACISKMLPFRGKDLNANKRNSLRKQIMPGQLSSGPKLAAQEEIALLTTENDATSNFGDEDTVFIAFARIFSGKFQRGDKIYVLGPRHDPSRIEAGLVESIDESKQLDDLGLSEHITVATIGNCYLLMGRETEKVDFALAGNIVGIQGLDKHLIRTATLSSDIYCPAFNDMHLPATPILRVAIEPKNPLDMTTLVGGLKLLNQADPCVEVKLQQTGEHVIIATGEVHLQHCIRDLRERYANNIELNISQPIVPFRETLVLPPKTDMVNETIDDNNMVSSISSRKSSNKLGAVELLTPNKRCKIKIRASPLPENVLKCLSEHSEELKIIAKLTTLGLKSSQHSSDNISEFNRRRIQKFKLHLIQALDESRKERTEWKHLFNENSIERIWSFGPKYSGPNILIASQEVDLDYNQWPSSLPHNSLRSSNQGGFRDFIDSFISGFQLASQSGPLCEEPMMGVCFTILDWSAEDVAQNADMDRSKGSQSVHCDSLDQINDYSARDNFGPMSGQIISTVKECCRKAFQMQPQRLMSPMFSCDIQVTTEVLGKMYAVLGRRNGRILHGDMREGSQTFEIKAFIPVIESLDFVSEIRKQTSGMANPQLIFSHYEIIDVDPFWTPNTEEEYALFGEKADTENQARKYMNLVRRRKGLAVQEKTVEHGEKQRTIKRNK